MFRVASCPYPLVIVGISLVGWNTKAASTIDPPIRLVLRAALSYAGLDDHHRSAARKKNALRWSTCLPRISAGFSQTVGDATYWDLGTRATNQIDRNIRLATRWNIHATWDLSKLVFHPASLAIEKHQANESRRRQQLIQRIVSMYVRRKQLLNSIQHAASPQEDLQDIERLTEELNALTNGFWWRWTKFAK